MAFWVFFSRGGFCPGGGFCPLHILSITTYILLWQWLYFWGFCPGRILSRENFVLYLCTLMVSLMTYGILEYFFPGEDFVLCIFSPLLLTFYCGNDYIFEDFVLGEFCPGRILSWEDFVLYLCTLMVCLMIYGILEYFFPWGGFCPGEGFCPHHLFSITTYIQLWQWLDFGGFCPGGILSREDFVLVEFYPLSMHING